MPSHVPSPSSTHSHRVRRIAVAALDPQGGDLAGVRVDVFVGDAHAGVFATAAGRARASLEIDDALASVRLLARYGRQELAADLGRDIDSYVFRFAVMRDKAAAGPAEAQCPDGTRGLPCVTCSVGGTQVRICV